MIELKGLCRTYVIGQSPVHALNHVTLTIESGELTPSACLFCGDVHQRGREYCSDSCRNKDWQRFTEKW